MAYLPPFPDDQAPDALLGSSGVPTVLGVAYTYTSEVDLYGYDSVVFFVYISDKDTAATLTFCFQEADTTGGTFGWVPAEDSPAVAAGVGATNIGRYEPVFDISDASYAVTFQIPLSHRARGGRYVRLGIKSDAGTPEGWVTGMRKGR